MEHHSQQPRYLRTAAAAAYLGLSPATLHKKRCSGDGPPYCRPAGTRVVLYDVLELDAWMAGGARCSTAEYHTAESLRDKQSTGRPPSAVKRTGSSTPRRKPQPV